MTRFLAAGSVSDAPECGDVEPHETTGGFRPSSSSTWDEANAVFRLFGVEAEKVTAPPEWATFASLALPVAAVPMAAGLFPQRVRTIPTNAGLVAAPEAVPGLSGLHAWVRKALGSQSPTALLLASGIAAGLGSWADAEAALVTAEPLCVGSWRQVWENQQAAIQWLRGETDNAAVTWTQHGNQDLVAINRGMAELFARKSGHGCRALQDAADRLPDESGWSHLAKLYLSLAKVQS
jgi:hypothetical protein